jgi:hypothetical protein
MQWLIRGGFLAAGVAIGLLFIFARPNRASRLPDTERTGVNAVAHSANDPARPWGDLEALEIPLADTDEFFPDRSERLRSPHWFFADFSESQLVAFLNSCDLTPTQRTQLVSQVQWQVASNGFLASPPPAIVSGLSKYAREQIYSALARSGENYPQVYPFRFPLNGFDTEFAETGLVPDKLDFIRNLTYTNSGNLCFADLELLPGILSSNEFAAVLDRLYRFPAYRLRVRIFPDSNIDALVKYWGKGGREHRIRPLLDSLRSVHKTNGTTISIGFLLPQFARARLYTFPDGWNEPQVSKEDCFWTSLNFFNEKPDMKFLDPQYVRDYLHAHYEPVEGEPTYGDLVTLINEHGDGLHACVYIADNFVFTKNGMNELSPWVLMKIPDMLLYFPGDNGKRLVILRRKVSQDSG